MRTKIYLIRHGMTEMNGKNKFQGSTNQVLSEEGIYQANCVAQRLVNCDIQAIASSDLIRAKETAKRLAEKININVEIKEDLREIDFGKWEGLSSEEIMAQYEKEFALWKESPSKAVLPGGESLKLAGIRGLNCVKEMIKKYEGKNIAVFSHACIIKAIILQALELDIDIYKKFFLLNTSISIIEYKEDGEFVLSLLNDTNHLD